MATVEASTNVFLNADYNVGKGGDDSSTAVPPATSKLSWN